jgi:hypothetical protein
MQEKLQNYFSLLAEASTSQSADETQPPKKRSKGPYCCVYSCNSCKGYDKIGFFKVMRKSSEHQTDAWRRAIRRQNPDGTLWNPSKWTVICEKHFIGGKPSNNRQNPDYAPTQFISHTPATAAKSEKACERYERVKNRTEANVHDVSDEVNYHSFKKTL